jgi:hypothetical protein
VRQICRSMGYAVTGPNINQVSLRNHA